MSSKTPEQNLLDQDRMLIMHTPQAHIYSGLDIPDTHDFASPVSDLDTQGTGIRHIPDESFDNPVHCFAQ